MAPIEDPEDHTDVKESSNDQVTNNRDTSNNPSFLSPRSGEESTQQTSQRPALTYNAQSQYDFPVSRTRCVIVLARVLDSDDTKVPDIFIPDEEIQDWWINRNDIPIMYYGVGHLPARTQWVLKNKLAEDFEGWEVELVKQGCPAPLKVHRIDVFLRKRRTWKMQKEKKEEGEDLEEELEEESGEEMEEESGEELEEESGEELEEESGEESGEELEEESGEEERVWGKEHRVL